MPYINCNNVTIHYDEIGEGYPFFFLHGLGNDNKQTREMYAPVEGVRCIIPDQRAHGLSSWDGNISFELMCADVLALADHLGIERFAIGGISMGAAVSIYTRLHYPEKVAGLFLVRNAWAGEAMTDDNVQLFSALSAALGKNDITMLDDCPQYREHRKTSSGFRDFFKDPVALRTYRKYDMVPRLKPFDSLRQLKEIKVPVMILANHQDFIHPFHFGELIHEAIPGSVFHETACKRINREQYYRDLAVYLKEFFRLLDI